MTIVVAGYDEKGWARAYGKRTLQPLELHDLAEAYIISDSRLSSGSGGDRRVVSDDAPKVERLGVEVRRPLLAPRGYATNQTEPLFSTSCGFAYAGNEFLGRTITDRLRRALSFEYTWISKKREAGHYAICHRDSPQALRFSNASYNDDIDFEFKDLPPLASAHVADTLGAVMREVADDILKNEMENRRLKDYLKTSFVLGAACYAKKTVAIHRGSYRRDESVDPPWIQPLVEEVKRDDLVVLGQESWKAELQQVRDEARKVRGRVLGPMQAAVKRLIAAAEPDNFVGGGVQAGVLTVEGFELRT